MEMKEHRKKANSMDVVKKERRAPTTAIHQKDKLKSGRKESKTGGRTKKHG